MNLPSESLYNAWRDLFYANIDSGFQGDEMIDYLDDAFEEWMGLFHDERPSGSQIVQFAWQMNGEIAEKEASALSLAKGD